MSSTKYLGSSSGLTIIDDAGQTRVTSSYNSGVMPTGVKLAALADTTAESIDTSGYVSATTGYVTNGDFGTALGAEWSPLDSASLSLDTARLKVTNSTTANGGAEQSISLNAGTYVVSCDYDHNSSNTVSYLEVGTITNGSDLVATSTGVIANTATGSLSGTFTLSSTTTVYVQVQIAATDAINGLFDNISVKLADPDRSVNGNGLQVNGTITKSAVATGAELMAYSGFSA